MRAFEFYLDEKDVKRQAPDRELAKSLLNDACERFDKVAKLDVKTFSKIVFENVYDSLRELFDALLAVDGYKSYSHEASIAYLKKYGFEESVLTELDEFRYKRNSSKYYGKGISEDDVRSIVRIYNGCSGKLIGMLRKKV